MHEVYKVFDHMNQENWDMIVSLFKFFSLCFWKECLFFKLLNSFPYPKLSNENPSRHVLTVK